MWKQILGLVALFSLSSAPLVAQEDYSNEFRHNEVKVNLAGIFYTTLEAQYDYILRQDLSVGVAGAFNIVRGDNLYVYQVTPNVRWFFGGNMESAQKYGAGFFVELNGSVFGHSWESVAAKISGENPGETEIRTGAGLGLAVGWKYLSKGNWVGEVYIGAGKNFVPDQVPVYPRGGVSIGYRF